SLSTHHLRSWSYAFFQSFRFTDPLTTPSPAHWSGVLFVVFTTKGAPLQCVRVQGLVMNQVHLNAF
ncbi:MAG: hypothetical protein OEZ58_18975, partial [Gammaproteobacteria bacterium]|nr:hypothetical protein [Gammaproteobacteria bacterium]